jgi:hypothetical protein
MIISDFSDILLDPNNPMGYANRGLAKHYLEDKQGAIAPWQIAANLFQANGDRDNYQRILELLQKIQAGSN